MLFGFVFVEDNVCKEFGGYLTLFNGGFCWFFYVR